MLLPALGPRSGMNFEHLPLLKDAWGFYYFWVSARPIRLSPSPSYTALVGAC